jgi:hypothetical protein
MSAPPASAAVRLEGLRVPPDVSSAVGAFAGEVLGIYGDTLVSIIAFGSAVTGDYAPGESDVNLLVVHASLDIDDLVKVGTLSRQWLRKKMVAPRFLSERNFTDYISHFQVDLLSMRGAASVLWGRDLLAGAEMRPAGLRWQASYEIKAMRFRIKQQFWRVSEDAAAMKRVLVQRFTSLTHLMRAALALRGLAAPARRADVVSAAVTHLGLDAKFAADIETLRSSRDVPDRATLVALFGSLLDAIRHVDTAIGDPA